MANRKKSFGLEFWRNHFEAQSGSGISQREYCDRNKLRLSSFNYWYQKLKRQKAANFIEIQNVDPFSGRTNNNNLKLSFSRDGISFELNLSLNLLEKVFG